MASAPISFTQRGAFQAANNIHIRTIVSTAINTGPPDTKNLNIILFFEVTVKLYTIGLGKLWYRLQDSFEISCNIPSISYTVNFKTHPKPAESHYSPSVLHPDPESLLN